MRNKIRKFLAEKTPFAGATLTFGSTRATEILARSGFDFLMVDEQHGSFQRMSTTDCVRAIAATETVPFVRVADNTPGAINAVLDCGALGVIVPMINSAADAEACVQAAFYPPMGKRSKGGSAPIVYGDDYATWANDEVLLIVMIETAEAVERAEEILAVPGIAMCLIGTSDLSFEMGCSRDAPEVRQAQEKVIAAGRKHGVAVGTAIGTVADIEKLADLQPAFFLISHDMGMLKEAGQNLAGGLKQAMKRV